MVKNTIIFDFDGTLADTIPLIHTVANELAKEYRFERVSREKFDSLRDKAPTDIIRELKIPLLKVPFILHKGRQLLKRHMKNAAYIIGMKEVLPELKSKGLKIGMLTSNSRENIDIFLRNYSLKLFDFIYTENNIFGKQFSLRSILKKEKLDLQSTIYVGDEVRDIDACQALDLDVIAVTWGFNSKALLEKFKPTYLAENPTDIIKILHPLP